MKNIRYLLILCWYPMFIFAAQEPQQPLAVETGGGGYSNVDIDRHLRNYNYNKLDESLLDSLRKSTRKPQVIYFLRKYIKLKYDISDSEFEILTEILNNLWNKILTRNTDGSIRDELDTDFLSNLCHKIADDIFKLIERDRIKIFDMDLLSYIEKLDHEYINDLFKISAKFQYLKPNKGDKPLLMVDIPPNDFWKNIKKPKDIKFIRSKTDENP